jgi:protease I
LPGWRALLSEKQPMQIDNKKIAILATNGFEQAELEVPRDRLKAAGATVHIVSLEAGEITGWDKKDWGRPGQGRQDIERRVS